MLDKQIDNTAVEIWLLEYPIIAYIWIAAKKRDVSIYKNHVEIAMSINPVWKILHVKGYWNMALYNRVTQ